MSVHLYLSPAGTGKTAYVLERALAASASLQKIPRLIVPTHLQVRACRRRLAEMGGGIGIRLMTFQQMQVECLSAAGQVYAELTDPVQYRLIRTIVDQLPLAHYEPLRARPGFIQMLQDLFAELKAAQIEPQAFTGAVAAMGNEPRLSELAALYAEYQARLIREGWADMAGLAWLAVDALAERAQVACDWALLLVDGFDDLTEAQLSLVATLAARVPEMIITLTGTSNGSREHVHRRFNQTRKRIEERLNIQAEPLSKTTVASAPALIHLEQRLFNGDCPQRADDGTVSLIEAPDRVAEARAALRWLKARLLQDHHRPDEVALLARAITPYRPFIIQVAAEFGLPIKLAEGIPLRSSPVIAALLDLLRLTFVDTSRGQTDLSPRLVLSAWRSPYFDWSARPTPDSDTPIGIVDGDVEALDIAAQWGRVVGGRKQWEEAFETLFKLRGDTDADWDRRRPPNLPIGERAEALAAKFARMVTRLTPGPHCKCYQDFVCWLETLIGADPMDPRSRLDGSADSPQGSKAQDPTSLNIVKQARRGDETAELDIAALQALKDVLRGLVWAEQAVDGKSARQTSLSPAVFLNELVGATDAANYYPPVHAERDEILVTNVIRARGIALRSVAVLGLAEGEFPQSLTEDPFLRDSDRAKLRERGLPLEPSLASAESELFYETISRPRERLLLTRPRLADNGAAWESSPFWEEVLRRIAIKPALLTSETVPAPHEAASWVEFMESLSAHREAHALWQWARAQQGDRVASVQSAAAILRLRTAPHDSEYDGDLREDADEFMQRFAPTYTWSTSQLEAFRTCPFLFLIQNVCKLEARTLPAEGLDRRQLGNIYHRILKEVYADSKVATETDEGKIRAVVERVAGPILDAAPEQEGFRETAWWHETRREMIDTVCATARALAELGGNWKPVSLEWKFRDVVIRDGTDQFRLRGIIDRVDKDDEGNYRVIDYKTSGRSGFTNKAIGEGKKLQVPLYARVATDRLRGPVTDGFYWDIEHAETGRFTLAGFDEEGAAGAMKIAIEKSWEAVRESREGRFTPHPPSDGCPEYCAASAFCAHYNPGFGG